MMRFVPCYQVVESMRLGLNPKDAAEDAIRRIRKHYPRFQGALIAIDKHGNHAGAANCINYFKYSIVSSGHQDVQVIYVPAFLPCV